MIPRAAELLQELETRKGRFVAVLAGLSAEQSDFRAEPHAWSPVQVGHHVVLDTDAAEGVSQGIVGRDAEDREVVRAVLWSGSGQPIGSEPGPSGCEVPRRRPRRQHCSQQDENDGRR